MALLKNSFVRAISSLSFVSFIGLSAAEVVASSHVSHVHSKGVSQGAGENTTKGMPAHIREKLQSRLELEGTIEKVYEDFPDGSHQLNHYLITGNDRFPLHMYGQQKNLRSGQKARVRGWAFKGQQNDDQIAVETGDDILIMGATGGDNGGTAGIMPNTFGERKIAVFLVNFQDSPNDKPWTTSQVRDNVFGLVNDFIQETSYNQTWLSGDVYNWITLPLDGNTSCPSNYHLQVDQIAQNQGVNLADYEHIMYMIPPDSACSTNAGTVGSNGVSRAWISSPLSLDIVAHEFGHNLGLSHAHSLNCQNGVLESNCQSATYGDLLDIMGTNVGHMNAFNKSLLGWLGYGQSPAVTTVTSSGIYEIAPLESNTTGSKALKIAAGNDATTGDTVWYYLEYRQPIGFDAEHFEDGYERYPENLANGVIFHRATGTQSNSSYLLDMTPDSITSFASYDFRDAALEVGQTYIDDEFGISITPVSNTANGISISVSLDGTAPDPVPDTNAAPVAVNDSAATSENATVTVNVLANDSDADGDSLSITSVSGVNGSAQISGGNIVFTPASGFSGTESFSYTLSDGQGGTDSATVTVTVTANSQNNAPVAKNDSASTNAGTAVTIAVLNNDSDSDGDSLTITAANSLQGNVSISGSQLVFTPASGFTGTATVNYSISDGNGGTDNGAVSVSVNPVSSNTAPVAVADLAQISSKTTVQIAVLENDYDAENDTLTVAGVTQGSKGTVSVSNGVLVYSPHKSFKNSDSFTYTISDGKATATATVTVQLSSGTGGDDSSGGGNKGKGRNK
ncbi:Ig-like domain-containing protein [Aliamphritea hakodatensis]|uniref:Ig-like domain-containing protein n=1 Tax=Aliamphritea hakodatensis TaxID=2895352 RepID=UPI0022FD8D45|nr:Ig-like domain-containing protein [Aliamphritea hakodatensis]